MTASPPNPTSEERLSSIAKQFGLRFMVLFGSAARNRARKGSDIDVGVLPERPLTLNQRIRLWNELTSIFNADVDLAILNHAGPLFGFEVARDGRLLYERERDTWKNWRSYKIRQYWDTTKFRDNLREYLARRVKELDHASGT